MAELSSITALKALDGLWTRATVGAENIANANTPGYRPLQVTFEAALQRAAAKGKDAVEAVEPKIERDRSPAEASGVRLDLQMATESSTAARYAALIEILDRRSQRDEAALQNG
ncbi:MAG TPA: hypothetical protein VG407_07160 [Caulobacteraceae bacterium]|jgi:flagellar basal-body rod protein FlgB|nr:hypothetical protein [Caulobacteraceae bacterium]